MGKFNDLTGQVFPSRQYGNFKVIEYLGKGRYKVRFIDTEYETEAYRQNINNGRVKDQTIFSIKYKKGMFLNAGDGDKLRILDIHKCERGNKGRIRTLLDVEFVSTGYKTTIYPKNNTKVKDYLKPSVHEVGCLGYVQDIEKNLKDMKEYRLWAGMIERCYCEHSDRELSYNEATTSERWKRFDYFLEDLPKVEGYELWKKYQLEHPNEKNIYEFDKDTKILGNKIYSLETCRFIHKTLNAGFTSWASIETKYKILNKINEVNAINE